MGKDDDKALKRLDEALVESYRRMDVSMPSQYDRVRRITKTRSDLKGSDDEAVQRLEETMRRYPAYKSGGPVKKADPMKKTKYADGGTVKRSFFDEINDLGNVGRLSSMGRGMSRAEAAEETGRSQARAAMGRAAARGEPEIAEDTSRETARETRRSVPGMGAETPARTPSRTATRAAPSPRRESSSQEPPLVRAPRGPARRPAGPPPSNAELPRNFVPPGPPQERPFEGPGLSVTPPPRPTFEPSSPSNAGLPSNPPPGRPRRRHRPMREEEGLPTNPPPPGPPLGRYAPLPGIRGMLGGRRYIPEEPYAKGGSTSTKKLAGGGTCRGMGKATRGGDYKFR